MSYIIWNCQGIGSDLTVRSLREMIRKKSHSIVFLMETKQKHNRLSKIAKEMGFSYDIAVDPDGMAGGLCLWWDDRVKIEVSGKSKNLIDTRVEFVATGAKFRATWIYGTPCREEKEVFWDWLGTTLQSMVIPWMCTGDFNKILWAFEKKGGRAFDNRRRRYLHEFMDKMQLMDLGYQGQAFTWSGKRADGVLIQERLDRG